MKKEKYVYFFAKDQTDGSAEDKELLGGKGANLAEMTSIGLPVPPGFTITTRACQQFYEAGKKWPATLEAEMDESIKELEKVTGKTFGYGENPLLLSVRSGAVVSMPGMMDTVLNLGLNEKTLESLIAKTNNPRLGWDAYRRLIQMFGDVVMNVPHQKFEDALDRLKAKAGVEFDTDLTVEDLQELVKEYLAIYKEGTNEDFPTDAKEQLVKSIDAVFNSWNNPRAEKYREINDIKGLIGTAVNVQTMVFGNMGDTSGTGVCFTRDPSTGEKEFYGEFLMNAQGEDIVAGIRTPEPIIGLSKILPVQYKELLEAERKLEYHYKDMQDLEFTIEEEKLYILQTRSGKRTATAAVKMAIDMYAEELIDKETAVMRVSPADLDQLLHPMFDPEAEKEAKVVGRGLPASPGGASGKVVFDADTAERWAADGKTVILCRIETSPEDIGGMHRAKGILTTCGGMTSHAAVVARGMGKCCVAGAGDIIIDYSKKELKGSGVTLKEGDWISLNGTSGTVYSGKIDMIEPEMSSDFGELMKLADEFRRLGVRANSDTPHDTAVAIDFGAEGIGLTRTEHMFFEGDRIVSFRKLIFVADTVKTLRQEIEDSIDEEEIALLEKQLEQPLKQYEEALSELLPLQRQDFEGIFEELKGMPCTIRLLDPPLHEFLPQDERGQKEMADVMGVEVSLIKEKVSLLHEMNPMLGHRGCRLGLTYPEISAMQVRAIMEAAVNVKKKGIEVSPEIMIPLVGHVEELRIARAQAEEVIEEVFKDNNIEKGSIPYQIGTLLEVPRAAVTADLIANEADFFSFGTNDLTQMGCGFSRDDAGKFLEDYVRMDIYEKDPFQVLDQDGVGRLVEIACELGRKTKKDIALGICGEHGGEPSSVEFCHKVGLDYVSCSPFRIPIARLAAAQAAIKNK
ncbi:MAG: pyruvate, phosphate dikinase [Elusimicrobia bacterium]|nr:pyruvate, phosphate dikinase [Elusimicrobiota bacterium]